MKALIAQEVHKPRAKWSISDFGCAVLAAHVTTLANSHGKAVSKRPGSEALFDETAQQAAITFRDALILRRGSIASGIENLHEFSDDIHYHEQVKRQTAYLDRTDDFLALLDEFIPTLRPTPVRGIRSHWRHVAPDLAREFIRWYRLSNNDSVVGIAENGPVVAFVAATIPYITGKTVTKGQVAVFLKEKRRNIE